MGTAGRLDGEVEADCRAGLALTWLTKIGGREGVHGWRPIVGRAWR